MNFKNVPILLLFSLVSFSALAQIQEGVITYETHVDMKRMLPAGVTPNPNMPASRTMKSQLFFNADESLCKPLMDEDDDEDQGNRGPGGRRFRGMQAEIYLRQSTGMMLTKQDFRFASKQFLIVDTVQVAPWKFGTGTKQIAGYDCRQAYYTDENGKVITAWYTDKLRPFLGPDTYNTLPGSVLALDINNGERVTVATKVELRALKKGDIYELTGGERISRAEFRKYMEEMRKRRQANGFRN